MLDALLYLLHIVNAPHDRNVTVPIDNDKGVDCRVEGNRVCGTPGPSGLLGYFTANGQLWSISLKGSPQTPAQSAQYYSH